MTLKEVSEKTNLTSSYLSQIERNITEPSISALRKVADALNVPIGNFLAECTPVTHILTRADERVKLDLPHSNVLFEFLTPIASEKKIPPKMEVMSISIKPKSWSSEIPFVHDADECIIVSSGQLQVELVDQVYTLTKGDSLYIIKDSAHRFYNHTEETATAICIIASALY